jgi:hypothetical protein
MTEALNVHFSVIAPSERWEVHRSNQRRNGDNGMTNCCNRFIVLGALIAASVLSLAANEAIAAEVFTLKSSTFEDGKIMPKKVANSAANTQSNPNRVGNNVSPEFSWSNVPEGTKSFVMLMTDPEGRGGADQVFILRCDRKLAA